MAKDKQGFIKLNRGFFDNFLWNEARTYSKAEAWLDLIQMARFEASTEIIGGKVIELQRGEIPASRRYLELRWTWGSTKVSNFLKMLTDFKMIKQSLKSGQTTILLLNFGVYNDMQTRDKPEANQRQTRDKPEANQNKELQEGKELKNFLLEKETKEISPKDLIEDDLVNPEIEQRKKVAQKKEIEYPFPTKEFKAGWDLWKAYRKKKDKFQYFDEESEQKALTELFNLSKQNQATSLAIIRQSIDKGWKGFFELKNTTNGTTNNSNIGFSSNGNSKVSGTQNIIDGLEYFEFT